MICPPYRGSRGALRKKCRALVPVLCLNESCINFRVTIRAVLILACSLPRARCDLVPAGSSFVFSHDGLGIQEAKLTYRFNLCWGAIDRARSSALLAVVDLSSEGSPKAEDCC